MRKLFRLLSILALASTVAFVSCKGDKGDTGPKGETGSAGKDGVDGVDGNDGKDGIDGNANIKSFKATVTMDQWKDIERPGIGLSATSSWGAATIESDIIAADMEVRAYLMVGENKEPLPISFTKDINESDESLEYSYKTGAVNLYYKSVDNNTGKVYFKPNGSLSFTIVAVEVTEAAAMRAAGVDMNNYNELVSYMNRNVSVPSIK